jgi:hypothetical protein
LIVKNELTHARSQVGLDSAPRASQSPSGSLPLWQPVSVRARLAGFRLRFFPGQAGSARSRLVHAFP